MEAIDYLPLWAFFFAVVITAIACTEGGYRFGVWRRKKLKHESDAPLATVVASILGLLAFMLGFTFNVALSRFDERRIAVLQDANSIGTTYLRADFLDQPQRDKVKKLLREYVQVRANGIVAGSDLNSMLSRTQAIQDQLWQSAATFGREHPTPITSLFVSALNDTIDMHSKRIDIDINARVPLSVWLVLFAVSILSMVGVGYYFGLSNNRSWAETVILVTTFALVMHLVADLDRPNEGSIKDSQEPMLALQKQIGPP